MSDDKYPKTPIGKGWDNAFTADDLRGKVVNAPSFAGALSFLRRKYSRDLEGVDVAVTGIPMDTAYSYLRKL